MLELVVEDEEVALRSAVGRGAEPLVLGSDVVRREVADDADAPGVGGTDQRRERLVAAEQRVDVLEGARVVAVRAPGREHRRQVEHVRPERAQVVEVRLDAAQVSAEPLERRVRPTPGRQLVPVARNRPLGRDDVETGRREAVGKDLVDDGLEMPVRAARLRA